MTIRWSSDVLDRFIAPSISKFDSCDAPDLKAAHPEEQHWLANHFLSSVFRRQFGGKYRQYAFNLLFRAQVAFDRYHEGRQLTVKYLGAGSTDNPALTVYFQALSAWESSLLNLQFFTDIFNRMHKEIGEPPAFRDNDGSPEQRAYAIANTIKHWGSDLAAGQFSDGDTVPLWMSNFGFHSRDQRLSFVELGQLVLDIAAIAKELQDPASFSP